MDPQTQTTFIPRKPTIPNIGMPSYRNDIDPVVTSGIVVLVWTVVFVLTVIGSVMYIDKSILAGRKSLDELSSGFDKDGYNRVLEVSKKLSAMNTILNDTISPDLLFGFLEAHLLKNVTISNMTFEMSQAGPRLTFNAEANSFNALAKQTAEFNKNSSVKEYSAANITLNDTGKVSFSGQIIFDKTLLIPKTGQ